MPEPPSKLGCTPHHEDASTDVPQEEERCCGCSREHCRGEGRLPRQKPQHTDLRLRNGPANRLHAETSFCKRTRQVKKKTPERSLALGPKLREEINQRITGNTHRLPGSRQHIHSSQTSHKSGREGLCWRHSNAQKPPKSSPAPGQQQPPSPPARGAREQPGEPQLSVLSVRRGPAPATTASLFNPQQLYSHSARQIDFTSPQLNVDNYGCLHQGTALPGLRRKNHIPIPLML